MSKQSVKEYLSTWSGKDLLKNHSLDETGLWKILGEDPNCDLGGHHYTPELGLVTGKLENVIAYALTLPHFYTWGAGGSFKKVPTPREITAGMTAERIRLEEEAQALREKLAAVESQLKNV